MGEFWRRLGALFRRGRLDGDLEEEMRLHLELRAEETGDPAAARRAFGNPLLLRETSRDQWAWRWLEDVVRDMRYAVRTLRRSPAFAATAILTLAVGVGVNTAMFSVLRAVVLRPLPYPEPDRLVLVWRIEQREGNAPAGARPARSTPSARALARWRERSRLFESFGGYSSRYVNLAGGGVAERVAALVVSQNFFPMLGVTPVRGRSFLPEEARPGHGRVVILSDQFWRAGFGADPGVIGKQVTLDGEAHTVIGVLRAGFDPLLPTVWRHSDIYLPLPADERAARSIPTRVIGRLRGGVSLDAAQAEMERLTADLRNEEPPYYRYAGVRVGGLADEVFGDTRSALTALAGAASLVLLIVCVNLASLMLARAAARQHETGIRAALGAGRWQLARQVLVEALLLGALGGTVGTVLAGWLVDLIRALQPGDLPRIEQAAPDGMVFALGLSMAIVAGLVFGALPALAVSRTKSDLTQRQRGRHSGGVSARLRAVLVASEAALALVLACGAGLLLRSYVLLNAVAPGYSNEHVLTMQFSFPERTYDQARRAEFLAQTIERIRALPEVEAAGAASWLPLAYDAMLSADVVVRGHPKEFVNTLGVTPGYFQATGISLVAGRVLRLGDSSSVVVNDTFCARYGLAARDIVGDEILLDEKVRTVVGVVQATPDFALDRAPSAAAFVPYPELATSFAALAVRTSTDPVKLVSTIRAQIKAIDPYQPVGKVQTMEQILVGELAAPRFRLALLAGFAAIAVGLAAIGVYSLVAYLVLQRRNEIGVRMALGAQRGAVVGHVLARGMAPVMVGLALGVPIALAATRLMRTLLFGVDPSDGPTLIFTTLVLAFVALCACYLPARRASRIDPTEALRHE